MATRDNSTGHGRSRLLTSTLLSILVALGLGASGFATAGSASPRATVRIWQIHYTAHNGSDRLAAIVLPGWYGPTRHPRIPVVVSPHGRNGTGLSNTKYFGNLPAVGGFAVISPDGMGRELTSKSYAYRGQIDDLARMPEIAERALPWLRLDRTRVYALGSSMGGHETLMLVARHPKLLAGAAAMDSVTDLALRYRQLPDTVCNRACLKHWGKPYGYVLQAAMRVEVGGTPTEVPAAYESRSPVAFARGIAASGVPLQIWWSKADKIVTDQSTQSGRLYRMLRDANPKAPVSEYVGHWKHSREMRASQLLPVVLTRLGLLHGSSTRVPTSVRYIPAP
jgi:poly(3-hydroxybutyrate) depolymerase